MSTVKIVALAIIVTTIASAIGGFAWWHSGQVEALSLERFEAGQNECRGAVEKATAEAKDAHQRELLAKETQFSQRLAALEAARRMDQQQVAEAKSQAKSQHLALNAAGDTLKCVIPDPVVDTLNRPIKVTP